METQAFAGPAVSSTSSEVEAAAKQRGYPAGECVGRDEYIHGEQAPCHRPCVEGFWRELEATSREMHWEKQAAVWQALAFESQQLAHDFKALWEEATRQIHTLLREKDELIAYGALRAVS